MLSLEVYEASDIPLQNAINFRRNILKEKTIRSLEATAYFRYYMIYKNYANSDTTPISSSKDLTKVCFSKLI